MKLVDNIITKYGYDKVFHFLVGGWFTAIFALFGVIPFIIGVILIMTLAYVKEKKFDTEFSLDDIKATAYGVFFTIILFLFSLL